MHDKNGKPLVKGDKVTVQFVIRECSPDHDFCNCTLDTIEPMPGNGHRCCLVLNTKQVEKID